MTESQGVNDLANALGNGLEGKRMASGHTGNVVPRKGLRVRISCPPLRKDLLDKGFRRFVGKASAIPSIGVGVHKGICFYAGEAKGWFFRGEER